LKIGDVEAGDHHLAEDLRGRERPELASHRGRESLIDETHAGGHLARTRPDETLHRDAQGSQIVVADLVSDLLNLRGPLKSLHIPVQHHHHLAFEPRQMSMSSTDRKVGRQALDSPEPTRSD
jgi:hypothetical protein